jgi:hypothetical protein
MEEGVGYGNIVEGEQQSVGKATIPYLESRSSGRELGCGNIVEGSSRL